MSSLNPFRKAKQAPTTPTNTSTKPPPTTATTTTPSINLSTNTTGTGSGAPSRPIHISRPSPKSGLSATGGPLAASCPTFTWMPPPPPSSRPRVPSCDPPPMALPPSPPVFSPVQVESAIKQVNQLKQQIYSRSLSNYSSSAPTHVDYLAQFHPSFEPLNEGITEDDEEIDIQLEDEPDSNSIEIGKAMPKRISQLRSRASESFSLSKSPTIFSILQQNIPTDETTSSGEKITAATAAAGILAFVGTTNISGSPLRSTQPNVHENKLSSHSVEEDVDTDAADDLQFSISLDASEDSLLEEDAGTTDFLPLY
jgi:hypothetical protein